MAPSPSGGASLQPHQCHKAPDQQSGLTVALHGATVHAATQAWLLAVGGSPASITVTVLVAVADLQGEKEGWRPQGTFGNDGPYGGDENR